MQGLFKTPRIHVVVQRTRIHSEGMKLYSALLAPTSYFYTEVKVIKTVSEFGEYVFAGKPVLSPLLQFDDKMARTRETARKQ